MHRTNRRLALLGLLGALALTAVYAGHFDNGFKFDDLHTIVSNAAIRDLANVPSFFTDPTTSSSLPLNQANRPVITTLNAIDYAIGGGLKPVVFHAHAFATYLLLGGLLFVLFRRIFDVASPDVRNGYYALAGVALWAFHPVHAETVNYIIARADTFAALCVVAALLLWRQGTYVIPLALGVWGKVSAAMFPFLLLVYVLLFERTKEAANRVALAFFVTTVFCLLKMGVTPEGANLVNQNLSSFDWLTTQVYVLAHYIAVFLVPVGIVADAGFEIIPRLDDSRVALGLLVNVALLGCALHALRERRTRPISFGIFWFWLALAPTSSLIPLWSPGTYHRLVFPYIGLVMAIVWLGALALEANPRAKRFLVAGFLAVLCTHAYGAYVRTDLWDSAETLWYDVTLKAPRNGRGLMNYGLTQMSRGRYARAEDYFERSRKVWPNYSYIHINLGVLKEATDKPGEAEVHYREAVRLRGDNPEAFYYLARFLNRSGRVEEARVAVETGLQLSPRHSRLVALRKLLR